MDEVIFDEEVEVTCVTPTCTNCYNFEYCDHRYDLNDIAEGRKDIFLSKEFLYDMYRISAKYCGGYV